MKTKPKIGLALGSGGVKGFAHLGVIKVLLENDIPIDFVSGSSAGAFVGAYFAAHQEIDSLEKLLGDLNWQTVLSLFDPAYKDGLIKGEKIELFIKKIFRGINFENLKLPFTAVVTDLKTGGEIDLSEGNLVKAVHASMSIPFFFQPIKYIRKTLGDGGLCNPVPHDVAHRMGADMVIAVNLDNHYFDHTIPKTDYAIPAIGMRTISILRYQLARKALADPTWPRTVVIDPDVEGNGIIGIEKMFDRKAQVEMIRAGEAAARKMLGEIRRMRREVGREKNEGKWWEIWR